jgi:hypothetical protein
MDGHAEAMLGEAGGVQGKRETPFGNADSSIMYCEVMKATAKNGTTCVRIPFVPAS